MPSLLQSRQGMVFAAPIPSRLRPRSRQRMLPCRLWTDAKITENQNERQAVSTTHERHVLFDYEQVYADLDGQDQAQESEYETLAGAMAIVWRWILSGGTPKVVQARVLAAAWISSRDFHDTSITALAESCGVQPTLAKRQSAEFSRVFGVKCERQSHYSDGRRKNDAKSKAVPIASPAHTNTGYGTYRKESL